MLRCGLRRIELPREAGARKPLLRRTSFWGLLMEASVTTVPRYVDYSYRERADYYTAAYALAEAKKLLDGAGLLRFTTIEQHIRRTGVDAAELFVTRA